MSEMEQLRQLEQAQGDLRAKYREIFLSDEGAAVLDDIRARCFYRSITIGSDPYETAFNEGTRSVVLYIERMIEDASNQLESD